MKKHRDYFDTGEVDAKGGKREKIHRYFNDFMKEKYCDMNAESLNFEDFYIMSTQFFTTANGVPVLFRDILFNLLGYFYALDFNSNPEETLKFYTQLIKENNDFMNRKEELQWYME